MSVDEEGPVGDENYDDASVSDPGPEDGPPDSPDFESQLRTMVIPVPGGLGSGSGQSIDVILAIMAKSGIKGYSINATNPAGYRGPSHSNDGGYHSQSLAIDLGGSGSAAIRDQVAKFWYQFTPNLLELIHSHTSGPPYAGWYIKNGRVVGPYGPASQHWNHVHLAIRASAGKAILAKLNNLSPTKPKPPLQPPTVAPALSLPAHPIVGGPSDARLVPASQCPTICVGTGGKDGSPTDSSWVGYLVELLVRTYPSYWALAVERGTKILNYKEADAAFLGAIAQFVAAHKNFVPAGYVWKGCVTKEIWSIFQPESPGARV